MKTVGRHPEKNRLNFINQIVIKRDLKMASKTFNEQIFNS